MNCAIPRAPAGETAFGLKFDSAYSSATSSAADMVQRRAASAIAGAEPGGTNDGTARRPSGGP